jgi:hypothetical protein
MVIHIGKKVWLYKQLIQQFLCDKAGVRRIDSKGIAEPVKLLDGFFRR